MWKDIPGYDGVYQVSTEGEIRRVLKNGNTRFLTPFTHKTANKKRFVIKLITPDGRRKESTIIRIVAETFLGPCPIGHVAYHINGLQSDNSLRNISYISRREFAKKTGAESKRRPVVKMDKNGEAIEFYRSARAAGKANYLSYQAILNRCNNKVKDPFLLDGYNYQWDDIDYWKRRRRKKA